MATCENCGSRTVEGSHACLVCGAELAAKAEDVAKQSKTNTLTKAVALGLAILLGIGAFISRDEIKAALEGARTIRCLNRMDSELARLRAAGWEETQNWENDGRICLVEPKAEATPRQ